MMKYEKYRGELKITNIQSKKIGKHRIENIEEEVELSGWIKKEII